MTRVVLPVLLVATGARGEDVKPRVLILVDTSGSMAGDVCGSGSPFPTVVDDSVECPGTDVSCATCNSPPYCGNGLPDDGRMSKVKRGVADVLNAFGEATYALARFRQDPASSFACPGGGWTGQCTGADVLVPFSDDNQLDFLDWLDFCDNWPTRTDCEETTNVAPTTGCPPLCATCGANCDKELRPSGPTPIAASLQDVGAYLGGVTATDPFFPCRPYVVIALTDGDETCGGDPAAQAANLCNNLGVPVYVVGFATTSAGLNAIADAGCDAGCGSRGCRDTPILVDNETDLALAMADIIQGAVLTEQCNGLDDDCDGSTDEDYAGLGEACCDPCPGTLSCNAAGDATECDGAGPCPETCNNRDDDCNGLIDEGLDCRGEVCNGLDDDGDGLTDELPLPGLGAPCGSSEGECEMGVTCCAPNGTFACCGSIGPAIEICDCLDNNCNTLTDEGVTRRCYAGPASECPDPESGSCLGICRPGYQACVTDFCPVPSYGPCIGEVGPRTETCNCLDDDCNGATDDGATCANGAPCIDCVCAPLCDPGAEFPCPVDLLCSGRCGGSTPHRCVPAPCNGIRCEPGFFCDECTGECLDLCYSTECGALTCCRGKCCESWQSCELAEGRCVDASCSAFPGQCEKDELCVDHACVPNPCAGVECADGERCEGGKCVVIGPDAPCPDGCPDGFACRMGECASLTSSVTSGGAGGCACGVREQGQGGSLLVVAMGLVCIGIRVSRTLRRGARRLHCRRLS